MLSMESDGENELNKGGNKENLELHSVILGKAMVSHSSTLAWEILWTEEPGQLQPIGSRKVGRDWESSLSLFTFMNWSRE